MLDGEKESEWHVRQSRKERDAFSLAMAASRLDGVLGGGGVGEGGPRISVHVFAWKRTVSFKRLLDSIREAEYGDHRSVSLTIHVDEGASRGVEELAQDFEWHYGRKIIDRKVAHTGLEQLMTNAWNPKDDDEFAIFLEDDVEVSPLYFIYASYCAKMFLLPADERSQLMGCSLYTPRLNEISFTQDPQNPPEWTPEMAFEGTPFNGTRLYLMQLPCSWGAIYQARQWKLFVDFFQWRKGKGKMMPDVPRVRSNWWKQSWKRYLIEYMYLYGNVLIYPSFPNQTSFTTNHYEQGIHSVGDAQTAEITDQLRHEADQRFTVPLMSRDQAEETFDALPRTVEEAGRAVMPVVNLQHEVERGGLRRLMKRSAHLRAWYVAKRYGRGRGRRTEG
ncbi:hypothetical protein HDU67_002494 [Dinochytrium kinnereticum]|nr:hypothetical protein HDU67_002494 [Dinochytrium kinnereticum]